jgi:hypothetical protein
MKCEKCGLNPKYLVHDEKWVLFGITIYHRKETYDLMENKK